MRILITVLLLAGTAWGQQTKQTECHLGFELQKSGRCTRTYSPDGCNACTEDQDGYLGTCTAVACLREPLTVYAHPQSIQPVYGIALYPSIILVRTAYFDADQKLNYILETYGPALLSNEDYESIDHLEHAILNTYLFLGTSEATEADAIKAQQNLDAMHLDAKLSKLLSKYHVPTHAEALDDLLRKQDGWADKL